MTDAPGTMSRRERLRAQALQEIEDASFAIIDADGVQVSDGVAADVAASEHLRRRPVP